MKTPPHPAPELQFIGIKDTEIGVRIVNLYLGGIHFLKYMRIICTPLSAVSCQPIWPTLLGLFRDHMNLHRCSLTWH